MISVLIVDDEILARIGIRSLIDWGKHGFEIVCECDNGKTALEKARELKPDIIISDVKMPVMNGIELIKAVNKEKLGIEFIMLSSFDDFALVKESMKEGACDYILKLELNEKELIDVLNQVKEKISYNKNPIYEIGEKLELRNNHVLKEDFLKNLIYGSKYTKEEIKENFIYNKILLNEDNIYFLLIRADEHCIAGKDNVFKESFRSIICEIANNHGTSEVLFSEPNLYYLICSINAKSEQESDTSLSRMAEAIREYAINSMNLTICIGVSDECHGYDEIDSAYRQACEAVSYRFTHGKGSIIYYKKIKDVEIGSSEILIDDEIKDLSIALKSNEKSVIEGAFLSLIESIKNSYDVTEKSLLGKTYILIFIINEFINDNKLFAKDIWGQENEYFEVEKLEVRKDYIAWIKKIMDNIIFVIDQDKNRSTLILRAKGYVQSNIENPITLQNVSQYLDISPNYFSTLFSQECKQRFIDYVNQEKIEIAKKLLKTTNLKAYEIAESIGYDNVYYFSRVFKKVAGMSPTSYKTGKQ